MHGTGIVAGMFPVGGGGDAAGPLVAALLFVLFAGFAIALFACFKPWREPRCKEEPARLREWRWAWFVAVVANLPIPLLFGLSTTSQGGTFGVLAAVAAVWLTGHFVVPRAAAVRGPFVVGGFCVALSQILPVIQIVAGLAAIGVVADKAHSLEAPTAFAVALLTAALLSVVALVCGFAIYAIGWLAEDRVARDKH